MFMTSEEAKRAGLFSRGHKTRKEHHLATADRKKKKEKKKVLVLAQEQKNKNRAEKARIDYK